MATPPSLDFFSEPSLSIVLFLQKYDSLDDFMILVTLMADPKHCFLLLCPLLYWCVSFRVGLQSMIAMLTADALNAVLKWPFRGDRPFWYSELVREHYVTCESGYGFPSGHVMVFSALLTTLVSALPNDKQRAGTAAMMAASTLVAISRVHVGSHFPGQVICGLVCGILLARLLLHYHVAERVLNIYASLPHMAHALRNSALVTVTMIALFVCEYLFLSLFFDPLQSMALARTGCSSSSLHFQAERAPFVGALRDAGVAMGIGTALQGMVHTIHAWKRQQRRVETFADEWHAQADKACWPSSNDTTQRGHVTNAWRSRALRAVAGLALLQLVQWGVAALFKSAPLMAIAQLNPSFYTYAVACLTFASITYAIVNTIPKCFHFIGL